MSSTGYIQTVASLLAPIRTPTWIFDVDNLRILWSNAAGLKLWKATDLNELTSRDMSSDISRKVKQRLDQYCKDLAACPGSETKSVLEHWTFYPHGQPASYEMSISAMHTPDQARWLLVNASCEDQDSSSDTIYRSNALLHTSVCVSVYSEQGALRYANPSARIMLGDQCRPLSDRFVNSEDWRAVKSKLGEGEEVHLETPVHTHQGVRWHSMTLESCPDPVGGGQIILVSENDITARYEAQQRVHELAYVDGLTGLPNRTSWFSTLEARIDHLHQSAVSGQQLSVLFVDLDRFKAVNDSLGHAAGDRLLIAVAEQIRSLLKPGEYMARLSGDEFTVLLNDDALGSKARERAASIVDTLSRPIMAHGHELTITPSIGASQYPNHAGSLEQLMHYSDLAMYSAKAAGGGYSMFELRMSEEIERRHIIESELERAVSSQALKVFYQPKICLTTGEIRGVEALLRWVHPTLGSVSPTEFVAVAEESGCISLLTNYVLTKALLQQQRWMQEGYDISVSVNVSSSEFVNGEIVSIVNQALDVTGCRPRKLELEITESMLLNDCETVHATLTTLHAMGVKLSVDDFGTGYSNLGYLQQYPLDSIKIDRSFLARGEVSPVIDLIIGVGKKLSLKVIAEGVETHHQRKVLQQHGCHQMQGFLFAKPMNAVSMSATLARSISDGDSWMRSLVVAHKLDRAKSIIRVSHQ